MIVFFYTPMMRSTFLLLHSPISQQTRRHNNVHANRNDILVSFASRDVTKANGKVLSFFVFCYTPRDKLLPREWITWPQSADEKPQPIAWRVDTDAIKGLLFSLSNKPRYMPESLWLLKCFFVFLCFDVNKEITAAECLNSYEARGSKASLRFDL